MVLGVARKRKWKEQKLMQEYEKVHQKEQAVAESRLAVAESVTTS